MLVKFLRQGHHPDIIFGWGYAKIKITTHAIKVYPKTILYLQQKLMKLLVSKMSCFRKY